jgi:hypothetical protein
LELSSFNKVDDALFLWFTQERERGTPLSGSVIHEKALQLNILLTLPLVMVGWISGKEKDMECAR